MVEDEKRRVVKAWRVCLGEEGVRREGAWNSEIGWLWWIRWMPLEEFCENLNLKPSQTKDKDLVVGKCFLKLHLTMLF